MQAQEIGEDLGGEVLCLRGQGCVAGGAGPDAEGSQLCGEGFGAGRLAGGQAGEEPGCAAVGLDELCASMRGAGQLLKKVSDRRWQQGVVPADEQVGVLSVPGEVIGGQPVDPGEGETEEQEQGASGAGVQGHVEVGQAVVEQAPPFVLVQNEFGFGTGPDRDVKLPGQAACVRPGEEGPQIVSARGTGGEPVVDIPLAHVGQIQPAVFQPP